MRNKTKGYAYLDDKDVDVTSVLQNVFDDMEFTFGKPSREAVGFIQGYPFYATYSPCLNILDLRCLKDLEDYQMGAIEEFLKHNCDDEPSLRVEVRPFSKMIELAFYFREEVG